MMRCTEASYKLQLYIDRQLSLEQTRALELHIASCADCREELEKLEEVSFSMRNLKLVAEPANLTANIMRRVALAPSRRSVPRFSVLRPSLEELLAIILLATITTLGSILSLPAVRALLPITNEHNPLTRTFVNTLHLFMTIDSGTLILAFWVVGTILGVFITLALAGSEMRNQWLKAMWEHLPVR